MKKTFLAIALGVTAFAAQASDLRIAVPPDVAVVPVVLAAEKIDQIKFVPTTLADIERVVSERKADCAVLPVAQAVARYNRLDEDFGIASGLTYDKAQPRSLQRYVLACYSSVVYDSGTAEAFDDLTATLKDVMATLGTYQSEPAHAREVVKAVITRTDLPLEAEPAITSQLAFSKDYDGETSLVFSPVPRDIMYSAGIEGADIKNPNEMLFDGLRFWLRANKKVAF